MRKLAGAGAQLALPVMCGRGKPLSMRAFDFGQRLIPGVWGIREPSADAAEVFPDILLVPLLAFERSGHRIGYGAGYYDLTIAALRAQDHHRLRPRLCRAGNLERPHDFARRAPRSRANRA
jgi:5-formyltetrahydrofolate cyclo-ligase